MHREPQRPIFVAADATSFEAICDDCVAEKNSPLVASAHLCRSWTRGRPLSRRRFTLIGSTRQVKLLLVAAAFGLLLAPLFGPRAAIASVSFQEFLFRTPSKNIFCNAFEWNSLKNGDIQCVVLSTGTAHLNPKEWLLEAEGRVQIFRPEDAPIAANKVVPYGTLLKLGLFPLHVDEIGAQVLEPAERARLLPQQRETEDVLRRLDDDLAFPPRKRAGSGGLTIPAVQGRVRQAGRTDASEQGEPAR